LTTTQVFYNYKDGFGTSQYPGIGFVMDQSIGNLSLDNSFELLHERIPKLLQSHLPSVDDKVKKVVTIPAQKFQFENYSGLFDLGSFETVVMYDLASLKSIHSESSYHDLEAGYYDLIYIYAIDINVEVNYKLINDDLTFKDTLDTTKGELIAIHCRYHHETNSVEFVNAELVLHEKLEDITFNASLYLIRHLS
jgi:hypothetical protein